MRRTLTCEAVLNFPMPNIHQLSAQLQATYDGTQPVTGRELAAAFQVSENAIVPVLRRCEAQDAEAKLVTECEDAEMRRELEDVDAELVRLSTDRHDLLDQASCLEKQTLAEQDRAERQLDPGYARQYREKAAQLEKDAAARRRDAQRVEKAHEELAKRRDRLEKQMRQV